MKSPLALLLLSLFASANGQIISAWTPCNRLSPHPSYASTIAPAGPMLMPVAINAPIRTFGAATDAGSDILSLFEWPGAAPSGNWSGNSSVPAAECATVTMPLCHEGLCIDATATVPVLVKRMRSTTAAKKSLWLLSGGPGASSADMESLMAALATDAAFGSAVDVYTVDHRGTGPSTPFMCTLANFTACVDAVNKQLGDTGDGSMLAAYSTTSAATDVSKLVSLLDKGKESYIYGSGYGSYIAQRLMQLANPQIKGYVLDGVVSHSGNAVAPKYSFADWNTNMNAVGEAFLAAAQESPLHHDHFRETSIHQMLQSIYASSPYDNTITTKCDMYFGGLNWLTGGPSFKTFLGKLLKIQQLRDFIPVIIYRMKRCQGDDVDVLRSFHQAYEFAFNLGYQPTHDVPREGYLADTNNMLYWLITFSELYSSPAPTARDLQVAFNASLFGADKSYLAPLYCTANGPNNTEPDCAAAAITSQPKILLDYPAHLTLNCTALDPNVFVPGCTPAPRIVTKFRFRYPTDAYYNKPIAIPSGATVLVLSGLLDAQTPAIFARAQMDNFIGDAKQLIEVAGVGHGVLANAICGATLVTNYILQGSLANLTGGACMPRAPLSIYGTPAAGFVIRNYGSDYYNTDSFNANSGTGTLVGVGIATLVVVGAIGYVMYRRHVKQAAARLNNIATPQKTI
ncbi:Aste57867_2415 [Aphanomyces stellatus]|uniref:Aste57867_2415 protein n=1 Tax=Aphanomyces stellatus TaxID=120398 RepID=A0A485KCQ0_9STRA|nr:hypothetical protein As57867_002409 [Aphanomyces stellatus]VFT79616.1 Aste57867_2415 [Aphanomyces stellatus]